MNRRTLRSLLWLSGAVLAIAAGTVPVGAIETQSFGLDVAERTEDGRLHLDLRAGESTTGTVKVWNKLDQPLALELDVVPAQLDDAGTVSLGGDGEGVDWVSLDPAEVRLAGGEERIVQVRVEAPRKLEADTKVVAIQVEPAIAPDGQQPAVVQRLALTAYLEPDEDSLIASLGPFPWIALAVLVVVIGAVVRNAAARRRRPEPAERPAARP